MVMATSDCFNQLFFGGTLMHAVIGIDVSKATSQVAVAVDGKVVQNFKITHDGLWVQSVKYGHYAV